MIYLILPSDPRTPLVKPVWLLLWIQVRLLHRRASWSLLRAPSQHALHQSVQRARDVLDGILQVSGHLVDGYRCGGMHTPMNIGLAYL